ncbi:MAG: hypothetical protein AAB316_18850, partial [Bacteroidota bacterium]
FQGDVVTDLRSDLFGERQITIQLKEDLKAEKANSTALQEQIAVLRDSVAMLESQVAELHQKISDLKGTVVQLNNLLQQKDEKLASLTRELNALRSKDKDNSLKIKSLQAEISRILQDMEAKDRQRTEMTQQLERSKKQEAETARRKQQLQATVEQKQQEAEKPSEQNQQEPLPGTSAENSPASSDAPENNGEGIRLSQQKRMVSIASQTKVNFKTVALRKDRNSANLDQIKAKNWRYTMIDFDLQHPDPQLIMDETFLLQIVDKDNETVMPMNEKNTAYPNSEQGAQGFQFKYQGKPVSIPYVNTQKKEGINYQIKLYYVKGGSATPLSSGTMQIVRNGEVVRP